MLKILTLTIGKEIIQTQRELIQCSVLSPILFNLFINDLMIKFKNKEIESRAYTDDIVCIWVDMKQVK